MRFFRSHCERELHLSNTVGDLICYLIDKKYSIGSQDNESNFYSQYFTKRKLRGNAPGTEN